MTLPVVIFVTAASAYAINALFGAAVRLRLIDSSGFRWTHHGLYIITFVLTVAAVSTLLWSDSPAGWYLLPAVVPLAALPYAGSARRHPARHMAVALLPLPLYILSLIIVLA